MKATITAVEVAVGTTVANAAVKCTAMGASPGMTEDTVLMKAKLRALLQ
jgi:hypothetical protein